MILFYEVLLALCSFFGMLGCISENDYTSAFVCIIILGWIIKLMYTHVNEYLEGTWYAPLKPSINGLINWNQYDYYTNGNSKDEKETYLQRFTKHLETVNSNEIKQIVKIWQLNKSNIEIIETIDNKQNN